MPDNIIPFPGKERKSHHRPNEFAAERISRWQKGLLSEDFKQQWQTFEEMDCLTDMTVLKVIEAFLLFEKGDRTLKTKLLQALKKKCPWPISMKVRKGDQQQTVNIQDVPLQWEEWDEQALKPCLELERLASDDPSLVQMARELWLYGLEKHYPFLPTFNKYLQWTAALHYYTLDIINPELAKQHLERQLPAVYQLDRSVIEDKADALARWLMQL
ncbi:hypothetical protein J2S00_002255 [Caldalkalibacillus uzonensis]|uniref:Uncharacterized protein n=1 Tax=Caldalkalibacillus uzonensis TaxID=353224 RepID=A0ABU0CWQ2_9BACI|nr:hypothetical protein [Caldalkalibacillus uzonensis]MDQ0339467.1 hypothetical protein [Caldalkalibacillus uzonensis]